MTALSSAVCLILALSHTCSGFNVSLLEPRRLDGWYNNLNNPGIGAVGDVITHISAPMRDFTGWPAVGEISRAFVGGDGTSSAFTTLFAFFEAVKLEIMSEFETSDSIACPIGKHFFETTQSCTTSFCEKHRSFSYDIPVRSGYPVNQETSYIDGSFIYGTSEPWLNAMRSFEDGKLLMDENNMPIKNDEGVPLFAPPRAYLSNNGLQSVKTLYLVGNKHGNQNVPLLAIAVIMQRWHNHIAERLKNTTDIADDEGLFQATRKFVTATWQNVIINDFLPKLLGEEIPTYQGYNPTSSPQITSMFQSAVEVVKSLVPFGYISGSSTIYTYHYLCNEWYNAAENLPSTHVSLDHLLSGLVSQHSEALDTKLSKAVSDYFFGGLLDPQRDFGALTLQRGRDFGLPDYNTVRASLGLEPIGNWTDFPESNARTALEKIYNQSSYPLSHIDLFTGGMLESEEELGETFSKIWNDQLLRIRDSDRFWFENDRFFDDDDKEWIKEMTMTRIVQSVTNLEHDAFLINTAKSNPLAALKSIDTSKCGKYKSYDFFDGSAPAYIVSILVILATPCICFAIIFVLRKFKDRVPGLNPEYKRRSEYGTAAMSDYFFAFDKPSASTRRRVKIRLRAPDGVITVSSKDDDLLRQIRLERLKHLILLRSQGPRLDFLVAATFPPEHDLIVSFDEGNSAEEFCKSVSDFATARGVRASSFHETYDEFLNKVVFEQDRRKGLQKFFENAFDEVIGGKGTKRTSSGPVSKMKVNIEEFAEALKLRPSSTFVQKMFELSDPECTGYATYTGFSAALALLCKGSFGDKMKFLFSIYDKNGDGRLDRNEMRDMITSIYEVVQVKGTDATVNPDAIAESLMDTTPEDELTFSVFMKMAKRNGDHIAQRSRSIFFDRGISLENGDADGPPLPTEVAHPHSNTHLCYSPKSQQRWDSISRFTEVYWRHIFILTLVVGASFVIFLKVFLDFAYFTEQKSLRRVMGNWLSAAKGSGASIWFTFGLLLVSVSKHILTRLHGTILSNYIPFDSSVEFHKIIAYLMYFYSTIHVVTHFVNFYEISTQPPEVVECVFPKYLIDSDVLPNFGWYLYSTRVGLTGLLLTILLIVMLVFSLPFIRAFAFKVFWITHHIYPVVFVLLVIHGCMGNFKNVQFYLMIVIPAAIYVLDWVVNLRVKGSKVRIVNSAVLPSDVLHIALGIPGSMTYISGQWVRICCPEISPHEYHPFSITSAPHQKHLELYIRAVGPWTRAIRNMMEARNASHDDPPLIIMHGPYGSVHQDWYKFDSVVLIGSGIGVTPHASVLRDLVYKTNLQDRLIRCRKVHFLWLSRNHRQFEWFIEILRDVEQSDKKGIVSIDIYVTQLMKNYDVRTMMLYICENSFHKVSDRSIFTGLKAKTRFHRPNFVQYLERVCNENRTSERIGVFTCGAKPVVRAVDAACESVNSGISRHGGPLLVAHDEIF